MASGLIGEFGLDYFLDIKDIHVFFYVYLFFLHICHVLIFVLYLFLHQFKALGPFLITSCAFL